MSDCLFTENRLFEGLRKRNVEYLLDLLAATRFSTKSYLQKRFKEHASEFDLTVEALSQLSIVRWDGSTFLSLLTPAEEDMRKKHFAHWLLGRITKRREFATRMSAYFEPFDLENDRLIWKAGTATSQHYSDVRDALMDIKAVAVDIAEGKYYLAREFGYLHALAHESRRATSPDKLRSVLVARDEFGRRAELAVLQFEKERLGETYWDRIVHTAASDVSAGYDVTSVSLVDGLELPRYVEVKAVSAADYEFFWTANEVRVAHILGSCYFLYLLPFYSNGFRLESMRIIQDPCSVVLNSEGEWTVDEDVICCRRTVPVIQSEPLGIGPANE